MRGEIFNFFFIIICKNQFYEEDFFFFLLKGVKTMKNPRVPLREAQTPTLLGKARFKEDSLWRQTAPWGRDSIWNPRVQLDRLWVKIQIKKKKRKGACWASKRQKKPKWKAVWNVGTHTNTNFPTQFLGIHAWCLDRSNGVTEKTNDDSGYLGSFFCP